MHTSSLHSSAPLNRLQYEARSVLGIRTEGRRTLATRLGCLWQQPNQERANAASHQLDQSLHQGSEGRAHDQEEEGGAERVRPDRDAAALPQTKPTVRRLYGILVPVECAPGQ